MCENDIYYLEYLEHQNKPQGPVILFPNNLLNIADWDTLTQTYLKPYLFSVFW